MPAATLTEKGEIAIPAEIRERYQLTPGTQLEFVDEGGTIRLVVRGRRGRTGARRLSAWPALPTRDRCLRYVLPNGWSPRTGRLTR